MIEENDIALKLEHVSKTFYIRDSQSDTLRDRVFGIFKPNPLREIKALEDINLTVKKGEFLGIVGRNGSGKSTLIHLMTGSYVPDKGGKVTINGKYIRMSLGMGFNKELSAVENVYVNCSILGLTFKEIDEKLEKIIRFSELQKFRNTKIKYFSKGMVARLSFSIAMHAEADIFLMDEFFGGVGDEGFRKKADKVFNETFLAKRTIIHVSHSLSTMKKYCDRVLLLDKGKMVALGTPDEVLPVYKKLFRPKRVVKK